MFDKVVYTYKEEGEGSPMYKHAIIPRREWWGKKVFGSWSRLLDDNFNFYFKVLPRGPSEPYGLQAGPTRKLWRSFWLEERLDQPGALYIVIIFNHQNDQPGDLYTVYTSSVTKKIIINHQNDHCQSSKWSSPGERLPHWSLLPDQLRLGQLLDIHHWGSMLMLSSRLWPILTTRKPGASVTM